MKLSIKNLASLTSIKLTPDLANPSGKLTDDEAKWRMYAALHEAAHVVACIACPGTFVGEVQVYATR